MDTDTGERNATFVGGQVIGRVGELDALMPAYAAKFLKPRGSEYSAAVILVMSQHDAMLQRNLVCTGITRGNGLVVLVEEAKAIAFAFKKYGRPETVGEVNRVAEMRGVSI